MSASGKCCQCLNNFTMGKLPRKLPNCTHNICEPCLKEIIDAGQDMLICGFCSAVLRKEEIQVFPLNTAILLLLNEPLPSGDPVLNEEENQLLGESTGEDPLCPAHKVLMDIICITDKHRICPHCALFGNHKEHRFKRLEDFDEDLRQKRQEFLQIQTQKNNLMDGIRIYERIKEKIMNRRQQLLNDVERESESCIKAIEQAKKQSMKQIDQACTQIEEYFSSIASVLKFEKSKVKIARWEQSCLQAMQFLDHTPNIEERLLSYYDGPLEIVTEGLVFVDELSKYAEESIKKLDSQLSALQLVKGNIADLLGKCFALKKGIITPNIAIQQPEEEQNSQINPFMDCTTSEITLEQVSVLNNSTMLEADITVIPKKVNEKPSRSSKTPQRQPIKSIEKGKLGTSVMINKPTRQTNPSKLPAPTLKRPISEITNSKISPKLLKSTTVHQGTLQHEIKTHDVKQPEKLYLQFSKNTLSDFFDISNCNLQNDLVVEYVHRARKAHKIRGLKLCGNHLTTAGFERMIEFLHGVSNINMANNLISESIFDLIVRNRDKLEALKVLNLSHNPITLDKKVTARMEEVKKYGIIIVL